MFVKVTTKSAQHAHAWMIAIIVENSPNSSHMYDHGFMDNTNRQAVKNWLNPQTSDASFKCHMASHIKVNIGSDNGLLPDGSRVSPESTG